MSLLLLRDIRVLLIITADLSALIVLLSASKYAGLSKTWETDIVLIVIMTELEFKISWSLQQLADELACLDKMSIDCD